MPAYLDFLTSVFGMQKNPDLLYSGFREQTSLGSKPSYLPIPAIGRSGKQYQICYNLQSVEMLANDGSRDPWSIRQAAIHHQFDAEAGTALWIITKGSLDLQQRFEELTGKSGRAEDKAFGTPAESFCSSLSAHLLWCYWSIEGWQSYLKWLEIALQDESSTMAFGPSGLGHEYTYSHVQSLQRWEEKANSATTVLNSNIVVMQSLSNFYSRLRRKTFSTLRKRITIDQRTNCSGDIEAFTTQVDYVVRDFQFLIGRARDFVKISRDRRDLVSQYLQNQSTQRMELLNKRLENEAVLARIFTNIALVYLPGSFVSSFFSTDVVKFQGQGPEGAFSRVAYLLLGGA